MTRPPLTLSRRDVLRLGGAAAVTAAVGGSLVACSDPAEEGTTAPVELQYMFWGSTAEQKAIQTMLDSFEKSREKTTVKPLYTPADYDTKLNALVASNRTPDLAYIQGAMGYRLAEQGKLLDLAPHFDKYPALAERLPQTFYYWDDEKTFGTQSANEVILSFYNRKAFTEAGIDVPPADAASAWSWDDYVAAAYRLTRDQEGRRPDEAGFDPTKVARFGTLANMWSGAWYGLLLSAGVDVADETGKKTMLDSPEAITVFQNLVDLMHQHRVAPSPTQLGNNAPSLTVQLQSDRLGMAIDGQWALLDLSQSKADFGIGVLPSYGTPMTTSMGGATAIFADTENVDAALELYLYQSDPTQVSLFSSGLWMPLEEKYYTDDAAIKVWTDNDAHPAEYRTAVIDYTLGHSKAYYAQKLRNIEAIDKLITPAMERIQTGKEDVAKVIGELAGKLNGGLLQGVYPTPER